RFKCVSRSNDIGFKNFFPTHRKRDNRGQVDNRVGAGEGRREGTKIAHIGRDGRRFAVDANDLVFLLEVPSERASNEARSTGYGDFHPVWCSCPPASPYVTAP